MFNIMPTVSKEVTPCFGVGCPHHSTCACYEAVNGATEVIDRATCVTQGQYVQYIALALHGQQRLF